MIYFGDGAGAHIRSELGEVPRHQPHISDTIRETLKAHPPEHQQRVSDVADRDRV
jgi:hypothetical protein